MIKKKLYNLLENDDVNNRQKFFFDIFLAIIIITSIILIFIEHKNDGLSKYLKILDKLILCFFIIEFIARFYVVSNFREDIKIYGFVYAIKQKIKWFFKVSTIIDFLAIIPAVSFFRIFRTLRFLRLLRFLKMYRLFRSFKEIDRITIILKGMKEESRVFFIFFAFTIFFILLISFALYIAESKHPESQLSTYNNSIWFAIKIIGFGNDVPKTVIGKFFATILLLTNMAIFGFFISIIVNKIRNVMKAITSGKMGKLKLENHIIICGYTRSSRNVINDLLKDKKNYST